MSKVSDELLPCPFCGGLAVVDSADNSTKIRCLDDNCGVSLTRFRLVGDHRAAAIAAWNRRAALEAVSSIHEAEPVAWRYCNHDINGDAWPWEYTDNEGLAISRAERGFEVEHLFSHSAPISNGVTPVRYFIEHDGFVGTVIGRYTRLDGKTGVVMQQDGTGTNIVHVYGSKWLKPAGPQ